MLFLGGVELGPRLDPAAGSVEAGGGLVGAFDQRCDVGGEGVVVTWVAQDGRTVDTLVGRSEETDAGLPATLGRLGSCLVLSATIDFELGPGSDAPVFEVGDSCFAHFVDVNAVLSQEGGPNGLCLCRVVQLLDAWVCSWVQGDGTAQLVQLVLDRLFGKPLGDVEDVEGPDGDVREIGRLGIEHVQVFASHELVQEMVLVELDIVFELFGPCCNVCQP